jgi:hypothetical protein
MLHQMSLSLTLLLTNKIRRALSLLLHRHAAAAAAAEESGNGPKKAVR